VLNETSTLEQLGKAAGSDRERRKATYPSLYGVEESRKKADQAVEQALMALQVPGIKSDLLAELARFAVERLH
jgi:geranylgeranyl diphosphate synthase type II